MAGRRKKTARDHSRRSFSDQQLRDFIRGQVDDIEVETAIVAELENCPDGEVACFLQQVEQRAKRILDGCDNIYFSRGDPKQ